MEIDFILMNHNYQFNQREKRMVLKRSVEWPAFIALNINSYLLRKPSQFY